MLLTLRIPIFSEVVIAPPSLYLISTAESVRSDIKVAAQNCHVKLNGAFTGEIRQVQPCAYLRNTI